MVFYQEQYGVNITSVLSRQEYVSANCLLASVLGSRLRVSVKPKKHIQHVLRTSGSVMPHTVCISVLSTIECVVEMRGQEPTATARCPASCAPAAYSTDLPSPPAQLRNA
jgi:hypothetical protein